MVISIIKRDGREDIFNKKKIENAIRKSFEENGFADEEIVSKILKEVSIYLDEENIEKATVEHIQDVVYIKIKKYNKEVAGLFRAYRLKRNKERKKREKLYLKIKEITKTADKENANVSNGPSAKLLQIAEVTCREYAETFLTSKEIFEAISNNKIYPHDFSWMPVGTTTCTFIPMKKMLLNGFNPGHGFIRKPKRIRTAGRLMCIIFQANQNSQHGGQACMDFDTTLAPYVQEEFKYQYNKIKETIDLSNGCLSAEEISKLAWRITDEETYQAMESVIGDLNSMHSRAGCQVPFTSVNVGLDTTLEGRMVLKNLLLAYENGLGKGEQPLFPNIIFLVKSGINYENNTPNNDLLNLAFRVTAKRLYPIYSFQDCELYKQFPGVVPSMGCRTLAMWDKYLNESKQTCEGRGNLSFTTINLPGVALETKFRNNNIEIKDKFILLRKKYEINIPQLYINNEYIQSFFVNLNEYIEISIKQLVERFKYQAMFKVSDFPFLMNGVWIDSEKLNSEDVLRDVLIHGTLATGFIGLAETLKCLVGNHHGESEKACNLGLEIIRFMRNRMNEASKKNNLNFSLIGTPAEGLTGKLVTKDRELYGIVEGVTDKEWYTNSAHIPVEYNISIFEKLKIEGKFVKYCNGGNITYVELKESPINNVQAISTIVKTMYKSNIALGAINFPCDRCEECGFIGTIETDECPICKSRKISRIRRITGYLAKLENFNYAKLQEALHRISHDQNTYN